MAEKVLLLHLDPSWFSQCKESTGFFATGNIFLLRFGEFCRGQAISLLEASSWHRKLLVEMLLRYVRGLFTLPD